MDRYVVQAKVFSTSVTVLCKLSCNMFWCGCVAAWARQLHTATYHIQTYSYILLAGGRYTEVNRNFRHHHRVVLPDGWHISMTRETQ